MLPAGAGAQVQRSLCPSHLNTLTNPFAGGVVGCCRACLSARCPSLGWSAVGSSRIGFGDEGGQVARGGWATFSWHVGTSACTYHELGEFWGGDLGKGAMCPHSTSNVPCNRPTDRQQLDSSAKPTPDASSTPVTA